MAKKIGLTLGIIFIILGILGFISNPLVGDDAIFATNAGHDVVHLILGIILVIVAVSAEAKTGVTLKTLGIIYLIVAILGFFTDNVLGFITVNTADNWLHIVFAIVLFAAGISASKGSEAPMEQPTSAPTNM
jgi:hypothetical protein